MTTNPISHEVSMLEALNLEGLRAEWRRRYGEPPALRSPDLVRRMLAWRIQAAAYGDLDAATRRRLRQGAASKPAVPPPSAGTLIAREWQGLRHEVAVTPSGFLYNGETFRSLSEIARTITGARWNGPRFFGLRSPGAQR